MSVILNEPRVVLWVGLAGAYEQSRSSLSGSVVHEIQSVDSAAAALELLAERDDVGCVVTAASLPDGRGVDLCTSIRDDDDQTPVILALSREDTDTAADALRAGATDCLFYDDDPVTVRERIEDAVEEYCEAAINAEHSQLFTTLLEETPVAIYAKDANARHITISQMPGEMTRSDVIGKTDVEMYQGKPTFAQEAVADDMSVIESEEPIEERLESYGPEGQKNWAKTSKFPWYEADGSVGGLIGVTQNITEYKQTERRLEAMEERVDAFTNNLQHDLKTPLQVGISHLAFARETGSEESLDKIGSAFDRIEEMVDDMGSMTKLARPEDNIEQTVDLVDVIDGVWDVIRTDDATLTVDLPEETRLHADLNSLRPVIENLFKNAITHAGQDVTITVGATAAGGFYVADDGPGIPTHDRDAILQAGYTTSADGSGRGLHMISDTVADNDWNLVVTDSVGGGARFEINNCLMVQSEPSVTRSDEIELSEQAAVGRLEAGGEGEYHALADRWLVTADGNGISEGIDDFYYVYTPVSGPVSIRGHVTEIEHINDFSTGALMIRDSLESGSPSGSIGRTQRFGTQVSWQSAPDGQTLTQDVEEEELFTWYRIDRVGDQVTCYVSTDGHEWVPVDQRRVELSDEIYVGLVATSSVPDRPARITFESIEVSSLDT